MSIFTIDGRPVKYGNKWLANGGTPSSELPPYDSTDAGKALVVNNEGDNVEWKTVGSTGVVDQNYDPTSSNAQSGTAVAEAVSSKQDTLTPGSNITIQNNVISATAAPQVQSNWTENDNTKPSYIQHRPVVKNLIAGTGITITETAQGIVISLA